MLAKAGRAQARALPPRRVVIVMAFGISPALSWWTSGAKALRRSGEPCCAEADPVASNVRRKPSVEARRARPSGAALRANLAFMTASPLIEPSLDKPGVIPVNTSIEFRRM
jgi:hypothetical protein